MFFACGIQKQTAELSKLEKFKPSELDISKFKTIDFRLFKIKVPQDWDTIKVRGIDSYVIELVTADLDTISSDFGLYSNKLDPHETLPNFVQRSEYNSQNESERIMYDGTEVVLYDDWEEINFEDYFKTTEEYYNVNGYKARIVRPKISGSSVTGIYIAELWKNKDRIIRFNLYGLDLSEKSEIELLHAISTLEFNR